MVQNISHRTLNAFLNANVEATVYLGVSDDGIVNGIPVSADQVSSTNSVFSQSIM